VWGCPLPTWVGKVFDFSSKKEDFNAFYCE